VVGVIALGSSGSDSPIRVPADTVAVIAGRAALAIDNALLYEQERTAAEILQRSLLPSHLPEAPGLRAAARYLPAGARNEVGGDWYDLFPLGPGRMGVVMGDVMGRGIPAASVMGQLRNGLRMLAFQDMDPAAALQLLNRMLGAGEDSPLATVAYGVIDVPGRTLTLANAGHMPTLLLRGPDSRYLDRRIGLPLGALPDATYTTTVDRLEPGDALILYTDGLIEQRDRGLDEGLDALLAVARSAGLTHPADPDAICDLLLESFRRDSDEDDTAALVLLLDP
jgi:serine phosphatase RsbU (regulator of sigma subunit)